MTEEFLHYIWQFKLYHPLLELVNGEPLEILKPGLHNSDSGPDFFDARIRIGETLWAGNVEVHILSSDWYRHHHEFDRSFDNVILHVVWRNDKPVLRADGSEIPTVELDGHFNRHSWQNYLNFMASRQWVPCGNMISTVEPFIRDAWLECLLIERLERKALLVEHLLELTQNDWSQVFYRLLARNMGFKLNNQAFEMLAQSLPFSFLAKHSDNLFQVEAMVFGQAGLLEKEFVDEFPKQLKKEYKFLQSKFSLSPIDGHLWRFMRLHPGNFPTLRLAQFASIIHHSGSIIGELFTNPDLDNYRKLLGAEASEYWLTHYVFDKETSPRRKSIGQAGIDLLIINLIAPILLAHGRRKDDNNMTEKPIDLLMKIKGENNNITRGWAQLGLDISKAASTQALIELKTKYCDEKKCLNCRIGNELLK